VKRIKDYRREETGAISATGMLMMALAMIFIAVGFIVYPIVTTATDAILAYQYSGDSSITDATFTGLTAVVGVTPLLILIGFVTAGVVVGFLGVRMRKAGISSRLNPMALLMLSISVLFIAVGLIIFPVILDGVSSNLAHQASQSDTQSGVTTAVGVSTGNVTLTQTLYLNDVNEVTSVSSNISETPVADNYTSPLLFLTGLTANTTRTITTVYDYSDLLASYSGLYTFLLVLPLLVLISFVSASVISGFLGIKGLTRA